MPLAAMPIPAGLAFCTNAGMVSRLTTTATEPCRCDDPQLFNVQITETKGGRRHGR
jgi:hypothetical protein